jgi:hypothetical protein
MRHFWLPQSTAAIVVMILMALLVPTLFLYVGLASSMALGACAAAVIIIAAAGGSSLPQLLERLPALATAFGLALLILVGIAVHASVALLLLPFNAARAVSSAIPLILILVAGHAFAGSLLASRASAVNRAAWQCFLLLCLIGSLAAAGFTAPLSGDFYKPVFPFTEPSHFAEAFAPLLLYCCVTTTGGRRLLVLGAGVAAALLLENLTLLLACVMAGFICFRSYLALPLFAVAALAASQLDLSYYTDRLNLGSEAGNLSSLVYIQGWQMLVESLQGTHGWGVGFQQLGLNGTAASSSNQIFNLIGNYANLLDGSFTLAKLVGEFGAIGIVLVLIYLVIAWRAIRDLRRQCRQPQREHAALLLAKSIIVAYLLEIFVRGSGYFTGTAILLVGSLWLVATVRARHLAAGGARSASMSRHDARLL